MPVDPSHKIKDANAVLDYQYVWTDWLSAGETISSATITASPGITVNSSLNDNTTVTVFLAGGTANQPYTVACLITTNQGRTDERTMTVRVVNR